MTAGPAAQVVTLFGRPGCHLCEEARSGLLALRRRGARFELREIDIERDEELHRRLLESIPVIEVDGEPACALYLDEDAVLARLDTLST